LQRIQERLCITDCALSFHSRLYFSLIFPSFTTFSFILAFPSKVRRPPRCPPHLVPPRACCRLLPECRHPAAPPFCGEFSSLGAAPPRVLRKRSGRLSSHRRGRDGVRVGARPQSPPLGALQCHNKGLFGSPDWGIHSDAACPLSCRVRGCSGGMMGRISPCPLLASLREYVSKCQNDWDDFTSATTFAYNCRVHSSLGMPPFDLALTKPPPTLALQALPRADESPHQPSKGSSWNGSRPYACVQERTYTRHKRAMKRAMTEE
jgi:hypothetical protein